MKTFRFSFDRFTIIGLAMMAALPFMALSPAMAAPAQTNCQAQAQDIRIAAQSATPTAAARALRNADLGEKICEAGNRREAARKFEQARRQLDSSVQLAEQR